MSHSFLLLLVFLNSVLLCLVSPQVASPAAGDCTFEVDECGWTNIPGSRGRDKIEWQRLPMRSQNARYHRKPSSNTQSGSNHNGNTFLFRHSIIQKYSYKDKRIKNHT